MPINIQYYSNLQRFDTAYFTVIYLLVNLLEFQVLLINKAILRKASKGMFFYFASGILAVSVNFVFGERNWQKQDDLKKSKKIWFQILQTV